MPTLQAFRLLHGLPKAGKTGDESNKQTLYHCPLQTKDDLAGSQASSNSQSYEAPSANSSVRKGSDREEREEARENGGDEQGASVQSQAGKLSTTSTTMAAKVHTPHTAITV